MKAGAKIGDWIAERPLGEGGMARVWLVRHATTGLSGALKRLKGDPDRDQVERFHRECEVLRKLEHPAIVGLYDEGTDSEGPWLVMEHVDGEDLEERITRGALPETTCVHMFASLAGGLAYAHERGVHHRDVKGENVILRPDGHATLVDFGVALQQGASRLTSAGFVMGTFAYLPPEVVAGDKRDPASGDIYALGQLLYESLTGTLAFRGEATESTIKRWNQLATLKLDSEPLDPGPDFPDELRAAVRSATEPEPEDRMKDIAELAEVLERLSSGAPPAPLVRAPTTTRPARRSRLPLAVAALALLAVAGCAGIVVVAAVAGVAWTALL